MTLYNAMQVLERWSRTLESSTEERQACEILIDTIDALNDHAPSRTVIESLELYRARKAARKQETNREAW